MRSNRVRVFSLPPTMSIVGHHVQPVVDRANGSLQVEKALARQTILRLAGSGVLGARIAPCNAQRVENNDVSDCQPVGIQDNLTGIVDNRIQRHTPAFVADDPLAVLTSRLRVVLVAVVRNWLVLGHEFCSWSTKFANPMALKIKFLPGPRGIGAE